MLRSVNEIRGYVLRALDGEIGRCKDFLFDDDYWTIRHMVADTAKWLPGRKVLVSPIFLEEPDWQERCFPVALTRREIENSPSLAEDAPVSRRHETGYYQHFGLPLYWMGEYSWAGFISPADLAASRGTVDSYPEEMSPEEQDKHLRSVKEVVGYRIEAQDGKIGHVEDFLVDDDTWTLRYAIVDTRNWLPGRLVLVSTDWLSAFNWADRLAKLDLAKSAIENSPTFDPSQPVNREYEARLYDFYGRPVYWEK